MKTRETQTLMEANRRLVLGIDSSDHHNWSREQGDVFAVGVLAGMMFGNRHIDSYAERAAK